MSDNQDRTLEFSREAVQGYVPPEQQGYPQPQEPEQQGYARPATQRVTQRSWGEPAAQPAPARETVGYPSPTNGRGGSGFPAAIVGAVVALAVAVASSFGAHQLQSSSVGSQDARNGLISWLNLLYWPWGGGQTLWNSESRVQTAFVLGALIVLFVSLLLLMAVVMGTRPRSGGFAVFLGGWMCCVVAGAVAHTAALFVVAQDASAVNVAVQGITYGAGWGAVTGWITALAVAVGHRTRRA